MKALLAISVIAICAVGVTACSSAAGTTRPDGHSSSVIATQPSPTPTPCAPPVGGRCSGPEPVRTGLISDLLLSKDGRTIHGRFLCGGRLTASETPRQITLTHVASYVRQGGMTCAMVPVSVHLATQVGTRIVIDGVTGQRLHFGTRTGPLMSN